MEEGLQGLLMGAVLVMFLIAMESALQAVDSSEALEQTVEERMMEQRTITVQRISEKESDVFGWMKYLEVTALSLTPSTRRWARAASSPRTWAI